MTYNEMIKNIESAYGESAKYIMKSNDVCYWLNNAKWAEQNGFPLTLSLESIERIASTMLTPSNVKVGDGVTIHLWSDCHAATVIKVTKSTVTVQQDRAILDRNFQPEYDGDYCTNNRSQTYAYERDPNGAVETFRWSDKHVRYGSTDKPYLTRGRYEFYDYNF